MPDSPQSDTGLAGRTLWEEGHEPGRQMVALGVALALSGVVVDLWLGGDLGLLYDVCFVALCIATALLVRPQDFFTVGVLPPLLMLGVLLLVETTRPDVLGHPQDGAVQSIVTGLAGHATALVSGYLVCLAILAIRHRYLAQHPRGTRQGPRQAAKRSGSPAPTRTISG